MHMKVKGIIFGLQCNSSMQKTIPYITYFVWFWRQHILYINHSVNHCCICI